MAHLTERQQRVLQALRDLSRATGFPPSVREVGEVVGLASPSSTHAQLRGLQARGLVCMTPGLSRTWQLTPAGHQVLASNHHEVML